MFYMYTRQVKLKITKRQKQKLNRMFYIAYKTYIVCVKEAQKELRRLNKNKRYKYLLHLYGIYKKNKIEFPYKEELEQIIEGYNLNRTNLEKFLKVQGSKYNHILTSTQIQCIADNVASAASKCLYGKGNKIHIKKFIKFNTISQKKFNGFKYNGYDINFMGERFKLKGNIKFNPEEISTLELKRIEFNSGYEYYINFIILLLHSRTQVQAFLSFPTGRL